MKKYILILTFMPFLKAYSQERNIEFPSDFTCEKAIYSDNNKQLTLLGNVTVKGEHYAFHNADKVVYISSENELKVSGFKGFEIDGKVQIKDGAKFNNLVYNMHERIAYLE